MLSLKQNLIIRYSIYIALVVFGTKQEILTNTLKFPQDEEQKYKTYFKIKVITRDQQVFKFYDEKLEKNEKIKKYIR